MSSEQMLSGHLFQNHGSMVENNATLVLHLLSLDLPDFQLCLESKMELSVAI